MNLTGWQRMIEDVMAAKVPENNRARRPRYLTKSRFKIGLECPTKLYYTNKPAQYPNQSLTDSFLEALAQGGYQVGELAKHYYPGGHDIRSLDVQEAIEETRVLLERDTVTIYEAAVCFQNLFIRIDILRKVGNHFDLIEVKAKSFDPGQDGFMRKSRRGLTSKWAPYLHDIAFQRLVTQSAYPNMDIDAHLMLINRTAKAATDGLNTKFRILKTGSNRKEIEVEDSLSEEDLEPKLLHIVNVEKEISYITEEALFGERRFESHISYLASIYENNTRVQGELGKGCTRCEFRCSEEQEREECSTSGYKECWTSVFGCSEDDLKEPLITDIWMLRSADKLIAERKYKITDLDATDIVIRGGHSRGLSKSQRQWKQVEMAQNGDAGFYLDVEGLRAEMNEWIFPLHFVDFETSAPALPFTKGMAPFEGIAFQFSHHIVREDGRVEHAGQFLDTTIGHFPNVDFIKQLKAQLENDNGTVFRYHHHENTYLNKILWQLKAKSDYPVDEADELCEFIKSITHSTGRSRDTWRGNRDMVDLWKLVTRFYYDPYTRGSTSIKHVLPAILNSSDFIKNKYSRPIYGADKGIPSLNFSDQQWVRYERENLIDPYKLLPRLFNDQPENMDDLLSDQDRIADGGTAMIAYARMQFIEMSDFERAVLRKGLLQYCELDTLAMVMIFEAWKDWVNQ
jgi:hypothetical protein